MSQACLQEINKGYKEANTLVLNQTERVALTGNVNIGKTELCNSEESQKSPKESPGPKSTSASDMQHSEIPCFVHPRPV
jgi:ATPase subunit of ABC transporter with duplicated ATPase domains